MDITRVTLLGHKDHGKSTLIGNLLIETKSVSSQRINEAKKISKQLNRHFEPGFILDSFEEEREGGLTIDTTRAQILYKKGAFEFIDVPGHEELIKNMISGASNADFAILMVSARKDEGIRDQTLRHLFLAQMLGIRKIIVAVNKMDQIGYDEEVFSGIKETIYEFLTKIGYELKNIHVVPISAYNAENLKSRSKNMKWYKGKPLLDIMLEESKSENRSAGTELRVSVQGTLDGQDLLIGRVLSGTLRNGERIVMLPQNSQYKVSTLFIKGKKAKSAKPGQSVAIKLDKKPPVEARGSVICHIDKSIKPDSRFNVLMFAVKKPGSETTINFNGNSLGCKLRITEVIDTTTGSRTNEALKPLNAAKAVIDINRKIVAEPFSKSEQLGRFVLYEKGEFSGIGVII
ncbi:MAG: 50S ribosome-binding GTPase [Candidatus Micrarchaeota archaeon]|nr:50S ribosome-binding GTPase [Candidatus Micrarchaeota archaeon]MDE1833778.1 50S ribosome-binding GTPase [Candidatus Micrarchaeota archaeon]MDE1858934.1 50S ribosome-binding GTPase [Candidatus Micrarchaeota archaeon]